LNVDGRKSGGSNRAKQLANCRHPVLNERQVIIARLDRGPKLCLDLARDVVFELRSLIPKRGG